MVDLRSTDVDLQDRAVFSKRLLHGAASIFREEVIAHVQGNERVALLRRLRNDDAALVREHGRADVECCDARVLHERFCEGVRCFIAEFVLRDVQVR